MTIRTIMFATLLSLFSFGCRTATRITIYTDDNSTVQMLRNAKDIDVTLVREVNNSKGRWEVRYKVK